MAALLALAGCSMSPPSSVEDLLPSLPGRAEAGAPDPVGVPPGTPDAPRPVEPPLPPKPVPAEVANPPATSKPDAGAGRLRLPFDEASADNSSPGGRHPAAAVTPLSIGDGWLGARDAGAPTPSLEPGSAVGLSSPSGRSPSIDLGQSSALRGHDSPVVPFTTGTPALRSLSPGQGLSLPVGEVPAAGAVDGRPPWIFLGQAASASQTSPGRVALDPASAPPRRSTTIPAPALDPSAASPLRGESFARPLAIKTSPVAPLANRPAASSTSLPQPASSGSVSVPAAALSAAESVPPRPLALAPGAHPVAVSDSQPSPRLAPGVVEPLPRPADGALGLAPAPPGAVAGAPADTPIASARLAQAAEAADGSAARREAEQRAREEERRASGSALRDWLRAHLPFLF